MRQSVINLPGYLLVCLWLFSTSAAPVIGRTPDPLSRRVPRQLRMAWSPNRAHVQGYGQTEFDPAHGARAPALDLQAQPSQRQLAADTFADASAAAPFADDGLESIEVSELADDWSGDVTGLPIAEPGDDYAGCGSCGGCLSLDGPDACGLCDACSNTGDPGCGPLWIWPGILADHLSIFGGVQGFKNGANRGADGSFGFHEGVNWGTPLGGWLPPTMGGQVGFAAVHSNLSGADFTNSERNQFFFTSGLFRHADYGLQGGVVFDYLTDDWYFEDLKLTQLRGELSVALSDRYHYGFWFAVNTGDDTELARLIGPDPVETWETVDIYALFYRSRLTAAGRGEARLYAGFTDDSDGIIGGDLRVPLHGGWAVESEFSFLAPDETTGLGGNENEAWNVAVQLVWYPGSLACGSCTRYYRPMFDVANNGSMIARRKR